MRARLVYKIVAVPSKAWASHYCPIPPEGFTGFDDPHCIVWEKARRTVER